MAEEGFGPPPLPPWGTRMEQPRGLVPSSHIPPPLIQHSAPSPHPSVGLPHHSPPLAQPASSITAHRVTERVPPNVPHQLSWDTWCHAAHGAIPPMSRARMWPAGTTPPISGWVCCGVELGLTQYLKLRLGGRQSSTYIIFRYEKTFSYHSTRSTGAAAGGGDGAILAVRHLLFVPHVSRQS